MSPLAVRCRGHLRGLAVLDDLEVVVHALAGV